jgi:hypothetical protein
MIELERIVAMDASLKIRDLRNPSLSSCQISTDANSNFQWVSKPIPLKRASAISRDSRRIPWHL